MRNPVMTRPQTAALAIVATGLGVMFVGAILPTPLYPLYRQAFGFSGVTLTLIYAVYVLGNLIALLFFGRLSDQIGRRVTTLAAIGVGIASALVFAFATGTPWLFAARALSGFSTGLASGTATAWIAELYSDRGGGAAARIAASGQFLRLRGRSAPWRRAGAVRPRAAAASLHRLSGSARRHLHRHLFRARDAGASETHEPRCRSSRGWACRGGSGFSSWRRRRPASPHSR